MGGPGSGRRRTVSVERKLKLGLYRPDRDGPPKRPRWLPGEPEKPVEPSEPDVGPTEQPLPLDLGEVGLAAWTAQVAYRDLQPLEVPLLAALCRHLDAHHELMAAVHRDGVVQEGQAHPLLTEAREEAAVIASLAELLHRCD